MKKIKLTESQILMLQNLQEDKKKGVVLKINESQYNRIFKNKVNESTKKINLLDFAQEIIVFIKDMMIRPDTAPFSNYWSEIGFTKAGLIKMLEKNGLLTPKLDEGGENTTYMVEKSGFRRKIKEFYNIVNELGDAGYPAGAEDDPRAPFNEPMNVTKMDDGHEPIKASKNILNLDYFNGDYRGVAIFKDRKGNYFALETSEVNEDLFKPYMEDENGEVDGEAIINYVNDNLDKKKIKVFRNKAPIGQVALITPQVKQELIKNHGKDETLMAILNNIQEETIPESTGASSSGSYVGGANFQKNDKVSDKMSPEKQMSNLTEGDIDSSYTHFLVFKETGKIVDGWDYSDTDKEDILYYVKQDVEDNFPDNKFREFKLTTLRNLERDGINPFDSSNWGTPYLDESTTTTSVGGDSGTFAYDAPAGDGTKFWNAGNERNKHSKKKEGGTPIIKRGVHEGFKQGQIYRNGNAMRSILNYNDVTGDVEVKQWGDGPARVMNIGKNQFGGWRLVTESKKTVLKITESQLKRILESDNKKKTAYPNGEMIEFDDCVKLNNNKAAQNGGCSQGAVDNVVKYKKTKGSVVSENFNPTIAPGSTYAIEVRDLHNRVAMIQDNGESVVVHKEDIDSLIKVLNTFR